ASDFPIQNLPFGIFSSRGRSPRVGVAIGDMILDVTACVKSGLIGESAATKACSSSTLNDLMSLDMSALSDLRKALSALLASSNSRASSKADEVLVPMRDAEMHLPAQIGDYTDFYASIDHATNVGSMFRPDNPLLPNYKYVPIGYHGRASSIVVSGTSVTRPNGQTKAADADAPSFGPSKMLDYESELGFFVGKGNQLGQTIPVDEAQTHIFGFCLLNDWSARDIQSWEYQPLGPFLAKNFATTVSPWIVTNEATAPYRVPSRARAANDPQPLGYLRAANDSEQGGIAATLEVLLLTEKMKREGIAPARLSHASFTDMYWTVGQMLAHHASNGCNMRPGDLLASGTVSGESEDARGCLLELTWRGTKPVTLPTGEERRFLQDGDEVIMKGYLEAEGRPRIGFGECRGTILSALESRAGS
ncbi:MAG TPA: fumarylacetoacetase, partial [Gemmatimonadaceae bacterium]|nr:fumarylacetoacetase [Gemmatimonadaceae bacterium]